VIAMHPLRRVQLVEDRKLDTTFLSFGKPLIQLCNGFPKNSMLEFGPGHSTRITVDHSPAKIISVEAELRRYLRWWLHLGKARLKICFGQTLRVLDKIGRDWTFSLIFIDAGERFSIMERAFDLIDADGMVFLQDAHREEYEPGIRLYPYRYSPEHRSCISFRSKAAHDALKKAIPPDYSCNCKYCSSAARRACFSRLAVRPQ